MSTRNGALRNDVGTRIRNGAAMRSAHRRWALAAVIAVAAALAGCGSGSSSSVSAPKVAPARTYTLVRVRARCADPRRTPETLLSFTIRQPSGQPLTDYRTCCEPHDGVDLIIVRSDDSHVQYDDSDIAADGTVTQPVAFPAPGTYRVVIDAYPTQTQPASPINFQLFTPSPSGPLPATADSRGISATQIVDGYRFQIQGTPRLTAIEAELPHDQRPRPSRAQTRIRQLARRARTRDLHPPRIAGLLPHARLQPRLAIYCTSALGATKVTGSSTAPGQLKVGVLLPEPGTWRMFLLTSITGRILTAPFTLNVS